MSVHQTLILFHVIGAGIVFSVVLFSLVLSTSKPLNPEKIKTIQQFRSFGTAAAGLAIITGLLLVYPKWHQDRINILFWTKMALIIVDGVLAQFIIKRKLSLLNQADQPNQNNGLILWATISLLVVFSTIAIGVILTFK